MKTSTLYYNDNEDHEDDNEEDNDDKMFLLNNSPSRKKKKRIKKNQIMSNNNDNGSSSGAYRSKQSILQSLPSIIIQKRLINLRSVLLATSLSLTLLVFWLLDSLKDATFATMVEGRLNKHQPLAKMASVGGTLVLVVLMEIFSHVRKMRRDGTGSHSNSISNNSSNSSRISEDDIQSGGGTWTKMAIGSKGDNHNDINDDDGDDNTIPLSIFRTVGIAYICIFGALSYLISLHPDFNKNDMSPMDLNETRKQPVWYLLGYLQYITIESYGSIAVATFWSFTNSTLTLKAAKAFYGFIIAIAQIGAIGGSTIATLPNISIPRLFAYACVGILVQIGVMQVYGIYFPYPMHEDDDFIFYNDDDDDNDDDESDYEAKMSLARKRKGHQSSSLNYIIPNENSNINNTIKRDDSFLSAQVFLSGVFLILKHNYLLLILGVSCLYEISLTCLDYEMKLIGLDRFRAPPDVMGDFNEIYAVDETNNSNRTATDAFATFMGRYGQLTNILSLLLSFYLFPYLMSNHGLKNTLRIFPSLLLVITFMTFVALPMNLPVLFISMSLLKAMTYSINDPAKEILYIPTSNAVKFKAKFWIDVVGARVAKAIGSSINTYAGTAERIVQYGSLPSVITAMALWLVCFGAGMKFDELLETGEIVGSEDGDDGVPNQFTEFSTYDTDDNDDVIINHNNGNIRAVNSEYMSDSGWESNVSVEMVRTNTGDRHSMKLQHSNSSI
jgi:hypothetical protein